MTIENGATKEPSNESIIAVHDDSTSETTFDNEDQDVR